MTLKILTEDRHVAGGVSGNLTEADRALGCTEASGLVELTPELARELSSTLRARIAVEDEEHARLLDRLGEPEKIAVAACVMKAIVAHGREGGSFRYLIYERLGFSPAAYVPLYRAGGMTISNHFDLRSEP